MLQFLVMSLSEFFNTSITWDEQGLPHSTIYDDHYFCKNDGLKESKYTFCDGNNLRERFVNLSSQSSGIFTIVETGFGTGLNFLCVWELWHSFAPPSWQIQYISLDKHPLTKNQLAQALRLWPELLPYSEQLSKQYPTAFNKECLLTFEKVSLRLLFSDVCDALTLLNQEGVVADAWFLDGFAPSKNPDMWAIDVFRRMAISSTAETTFATFTAAGEVRRNLQKNGFDVVKAKGFGVKRHMLKGKLT